MICHGAPHNEDEYVFHDGHAQQIFDGTSAQVILFGHTHLPVIFAMDSRHRVFGGDWDRHMYAYDASTGAVLWQTRLPTSAQGFPITYLAHGKQYVAMPAGYGGGSWSTLLPPELAPEIRRPNSGNTLMVFALPDR